MKRSMFFLVAILLIHSAKAQNRRVFLNTTWGSPNPAITDHSLRGPQAGYAWQNKKLNWNELELSNLLVMGGSSGLSSIGLGLRYQYTLPVFKQKFTGAVQPILGFGIGTLDYYSRFRPVTSNMFPITTFSTDWWGYVAPGVDINISNRIVASVSIPINLMSLRYIYQRIQKPTWSVSEQRIYAFSFDALPKSDFTIRAGIGINF